MGVKGAILGDIAGSQYEFNHMRPKDLDWKNVPLFTKNVVELMIVFLLLQQKVQS